LEALLLLGVVDHFDRVPRAADTALIAISAMRWMDGIRAGSTADATA